MTNTTPQCRRRTETLWEFPETLQPGLVWPMAPKPAPESYLHYLTNFQYAAIPQTNGLRDLLFVTPNTTIHQSNTGDLLSPLEPSLDFEIACAQTALDFGPFILDGERSYKSTTGSIHHTFEEAKAASQDHTQPIPVYTALRALFFQTEDLRYTSERVRLHYSFLIRQKLESYLKGTRIEIAHLPIIYAPAGKQQLVHSEKQNGKATILWVNLEGKYQRHPNADTALFHAAY